VLERRRLGRIEDWIKPALFALTPMALVAMQPDLGTAITIVPITLGMLYLAGARGATIAKVLLFVCVAGVCVWRFEVGVRDYQLQRVDTWTRTFEAEPLIEGRRGLFFHLYQARVAIGNGGWFGTGLGQGIANETGYLPERSSDSIVAVIGEEIGFIGLSGLLFLYALMIVLLMVSAAGVRDRFARLVVGGIAIYFAAHVFINVGVNIGLVPMTGLPLPLFSTGGSSLLATLTALGLALGLSAHGEPQLDRDAFRKY
jgi:rod shape determining protein RodA